jgi:hypothetical protein
MNSEVAFQMNKIDPKFEPVNRQDFLGLGTIAVFPLEEFETLPRKEFSVLQVLHIWKDLRGSKSVSQGNQDRNSLPSTLLARADRTEKTVQCARRT